jgi:hypothetical protein
MWKPRPSFRNEIFATKPSVTCTNLGSCFLLLAYYYTMRRVVYCSVLIIEFQFELPHVSTVFPAVSTPWHTLYL